MTSAAAAVLLTFLIGTSGPTAQVRPGTEAVFSATAYCDRGITKSGVRTREGIVAADPEHLPVGSIVRITDGGDGGYEGIYTVMDTGGLVQGHRIDVYVPDCQQAKEFGIRKVRIVVVRLGWDPQAVSRRGTASR